MNLNIFDIDSLKIEIRKNLSQKFVANINLREQCLKRVILRFKQRLSSHRLCQFRQETSQTHHPILSYSTVRFLKMAESLTVKDFLLNLTLLIEIE